jgi:hypothetical protein
MKTFNIIPDIHGRTNWETFVDPKLTNVFLGDYVDSFDVDDVTIVKNLKNIITFKKDVPETILLLGNHDMQYMFSYLKYGCSGYRQKLYVKLNLIFNKHKKLFNLAYQYNNYLFTHAGLSSYCWGKYCKYYQSKSLSEMEGNYADNINIAWESEKLLDILMSVGTARGGYENTGGIVWCDKREIKAYPLTDIKQVVGHTPIEDSPIWVDDVYFTDCYNTNPQKIIINV